MIEKKDAMIAMSLLSIKQNHENNHFREWIELFCLRQWKENKKKEKEQIHARTMWLEFGFLFYDRRKKIKRKCTRANFSITSFRAMNARDFSKSKRNNKIFLKSALRMERLTKNENNEKKKKMCRNSVRFVLFSFSNVYEFIYSMNVYVSIFRWPKNEFFTTMNKIKKNKRKLDDKLSYRICSLHQDEPLRLNDSTTGIWSNYRWNKLIDRIHEHDECRFSHCITMKLRKSCVYLIMRALSFPCVRLSSAFDAQSMSERISVEDFSLT